MAARGVTAITPIAAAHAKASREAEMAECHGIARTGKSGDHVILSSGRLLQGA